MSRKRLPGGILGILGIRRQRKATCDNAATFALEYPGHQAAAQGNF